MMNEHIISVFWFIYKHICLNACEMLRRARFDWNTTSFRLDQVRFAIQEKFELFCVKNNGTNLIILISLAD